MAETAKAHIAKRVNGARLWERLEALAQFGATATGGVNRQALSDEEVPARAQLVRWGEAIGLTASTDAVGNLFLRYAGSEPNQPAVMVGSHIDTQPTGGKYDGAYGVIAALEGIEGMVASGVRPRRSIDVVAWMNEEGSRFAPGMMGSAVFAGRRKLQDVLGIRDKNGITVETELRKILAAAPVLPQREFGRIPAAFVETHIEQGPVLQMQNKTIGVVTGMQGKKTFRVEVEGEENHAGTSPRSVRRDALVSAVKIVGALQEAIWDEEDVVRFTVGMFNVNPNAPSVVPSRVVFSIDVRHPDAGTLDRIGERIPTVCRDFAGRCAVSVVALLSEPPLEFPIFIRETISSTCSALGISSMEIPSGAGHDGRYLHAICPAGMIFIPCKDGISHNEAESILPEHATDGARVLSEVTFALANAP